MANRTNLAYSQPERKRQVTPTPLIQKSGRKKSNYIHPVQIIALMATFVFVLVFMICSLVQLNEVGSEITAVQKDLRVAQSETVRLNAKLESQMSLQNIASYAEKNLGLTKMGSNQVNYISVSQGNAIEIPGKKKNNIWKEPNWFNRVQTQVSQFLEYLAI